MGYPLSAALFVGPKLKENLNTCQWMFIFNIITKEKMLDKIKNADGYEEDSDVDSDDDEEGLMLDCGNNHVHEFTDEFFDFIEKNKLEMVIEYNYQDDSFLLGRRIENVNEDISKDIEFWKQYADNSNSNLLDVHIFAGMYGRIEYSLDFNLP